MKILVKVLRTDREFGLQIDLLAGEGGLSRKISNARVQKPGLALAGYLQSVRPECVQVLGKTEMSYLSGLEESARITAIEGLLRCDSLACVVLTTSLESPPRLLEIAEREQVAVFRSELDTEPFINRLHNLLDEYLSPEITVHGVVIDVFGVGVMLTGQSGIGKSETALDLVLRGHRLVADDVVRLKSFGRMVLSMGSPLTRHHMEVRGLGIINVKDLFGAAAVREKKRIELIVDLVEWAPGLEFDRTGIDDATERVLEIEVPKIVLPIRPGRNVASIVEVAARNHLLKLQGHHSAREFKETLERRLATAAMVVGLGETE
jgi:HPr kinase/phosphorylase